MVWKIVQSEIACDMLNVKIDYTELYFQYKPLN